MTERAFSYHDLFLMTRDLANRLRMEIPHRQSIEVEAYGVPRSGALVVELMRSHGIRPVYNPQLADVIVDDIVDSGATRDRMVKQYGKPFYALIDKPAGELAHTWVQWPWEEEGTCDAEDNVRRLLQSLGQENREGLKDTPRRHVKYLREFLTPEPFTLTTFKNEGVNSMIIEKNIPFFSICEHHLLPFFGQAAIAYIPGDRILGLSKLARILDLFSRRLQNQERITSEIAKYLETELKPQGVAVLLKARHMCVEMRGVRKHDTWTVTSDLRGSFNDRDTRNEFMHLANDR